MGFIEDYFISQTPVRKAISKILKQISQGLNIPVPSVKTYEDWELRENLDEIKRQGTDFKVIFGKKFITLDVNRKGSLEFIKIPEDTLTDGELINKLNQSVAELNFYDFLIVEPEILEDSQRVRLIKNGGDTTALYKPVGQVAKELKRKPQTLRDWAKLVLIYSPDFYQHYKPRKAYNLYVEEWFKRINEYDLSEPASAPRPEIIEDFIRLNASVFTFENYTKEFKNEYATETTINAAKIIHVA